MHQKLEEYSQLCARQARLDFLKREVMGDVGSVPQEGFQEVGARITYPASTIDIYPLLCQCWASVANDGPTLTQH